MPEIEYPVTPVGVDYICDTCGEGVMRHSDKLQLTSFPPKYRHTCSKCGVVANLEQTYPTVKFKDTTPSEFEATTGTPADIDENAG